MRRKPPGTIEHWKPPSATYKCTVFVHLGGGLVGQSSGNGLYVRTTRTLRVSRFNEDCWHEPRAECEAYTFRE